MSTRISGSIGVLIVGICAAALSCKDAVAPECASLGLSADSLALFFREPQRITAKPTGIQDAEITAGVNWTSRNPSKVTVTPTAANGLEVEVKATGFGSVILDAKACSVADSVVVTVLDTAYGVQISPSNAQLTVGDTITFSALVDGPNGVYPRVRWSRIGTSVVLLTSPDSNSVRVQIIGANASLIARARADSTKSQSPTVTATHGTLEFTVPPSGVAKGSVIGPAVQVSVKTAAGAAATRNASQVFLAMVNDATCSAAQLRGSTGRTAVSGVATFDNLSVNRTGSACRLTATTDLSATSAVSAPFAVGSRGCAPVGYTIGDAVAGTFEPGDCTVNRTAATFYSHVYSITVPALTTQVLRLDYSASVAPRLESSLWSPSPVSWPDSAPALGTVTRILVLGEGTHSFALSSTQASATGDYSFLATSTVTGTQTGVCSVLATTSFTFSGSFSLACTTPFLCRPGAETARRYFLYLPAGQSITGTLRTVAGSADVDAYLEVYDITAGERGCLGSDDNSAGGPRGTDAQLTVAAAPSGRWIEFLTSHVDPIGTSNHTFTIK